MRQLTKEIEIEGQKFQLRKMSAMAASRISNLLISVLIKAAKGEDQGDQPAADDSTTPLEKANAMVSVLWLTASGVLDKSVYQDIQKDCLAACSYYPSEGAPPAVVMMPDGRWLNKELETDFATVNRLIVESLQFNLSDFFLAGVSRAAAIPA